VWHSLEVLGPLAARVAGVEHVGGAVGCSPAATAAWVAAGGASAPAPGPRTDAPLGYLRALQARAGGPVPGISPMIVFERAWVVTALADAGMAALVPPELADWLRAALGADGAPAAAGLPADADDTAAVLHALALLGERPDADSLWGFHNGEYFHCFLGESTPSVSANAHVLTALRDCGPGRDAADAERLRAATDRLSRWLTDCQGTDGSWIDKWHASPFYATVCCVAALHGIPGTQSAVARAVDWVLRRQRANGSWGVWRETAEETAYSLRILLRSPELSDARGPVRAAIVRGRGYLASVAGSGDYPPLWHDKDLYAPVAVIKAEALAALTLTAPLADG
jgi:hypothetical protein